MRPSAVTVIRTVRHSGTVQPVKTSVPHAGRNL